MELKLPGLPISQKKPFPDTLSETHISLQALHHCSWPQELSHLPSLLLATTPPSVPGGLSSHPKPNCGWGNQLTASLPAYPKPNPEEKLIFLSFL